MPDTDLKSPTTPSPFLHNPVTCLASRLCNACGRPQPHQSMVFSSSSSFSIPNVFCMGLHQQDTPADKFMARHSFWCPFGKALPHVLPVTPRFHFTCSPLHPPPPLMDRWISQLHFITPGIPDYDSHTQDDPLRIMSLNCGGGQSSLPSLCSLISILDPDIICLQELWNFDIRSEVFLRPYVGILGTWRDRGQGLCTLFHRRLFTTDQHPFQVLYDSRSWLAVAFLSPPFSQLLVINVHLDPTLNMT